jgi:hypothetical protein
MWAITRDTGNRRAVQGRIGWPFIIFLVVSLSTCCVLSVPAPLDVVTSPVAMQKVSVFQQVVLQTVVACPVTGAPAGAACFSLVPHHS